MNRTTMLGAAALALASCVPVLRLDPALAAAPRRELRLRRGEDGDFSFGAFRARHVHRGFWTSVSLGTTTTLGSGVSAGLSAFSSWQPIRLMLEGPEPQSSWACRCQKVRDEDDHFVGLACDVGRADAPAYHVEIDGAQGDVTSAEGTLAVALQRAPSGSMIGAHAYASGTPVAAVRLQPDRALLVASEAPPHAQLASAVLAAVLFAAEE